MKPNWKDAPEWAQWLAQDESGDWWWYENEPEAGDNTWWSDEVHDRAIKENGEWRETLEQRPEVKP
jgi:hypothetical protein